MFQLAKFWFNALAKNFKSFKLITDRYWEVFTTYFYSINRLAGETHTR